ncbi:Adenylyl cyclase class-3/4/guanylyl cyclase [Trinorchestia longiramus]|nr:Adenylyl cyclase class-3/4/guanylyl cyclase [Trinorchestia longiramus]
MLIKVIIRTILLATFVTLGKTQDDNSRVTSEVLFNTAGGDNRILTNSSTTPSSMSESATSLPLTIRPPKSRSRLQPLECKNKLQCSGRGGRPIDSNRVLNISFLTTCGDDWTKNFLGHKIAGALSLAVDAVNKRRLLPDNYSLVYEVHNTRNVILNSVGQVCKDSLSNVSVFIGPEQTCDTEAVIAASANIPLLSYACQDANSSLAEANSTQTYNYGNFVRFNPKDKTVLQNVMNLLLVQKWSYFRIVYTRDMKNKAERLYYLAKNSRYSLKPLLMMQVNGMLQIHEMLRETKNTTRIYVLLAHRREVSNFLVAMTLQGMLQQPQLYFLVFLEFEAHHAKDWHTYIWGQLLLTDLSKKQQRQLLVKYSRALLMVRGTYPHIDFSRKRNKIICRNLKPPFCLTYSPPSRLVVPHQTSAHLYDAVVEYAKAVTRLYEQLGGSKSVPEVARMGYAVVSMMRNYTYNSSLGYEVTLDGKAESKGNYSGYLFYNCNNCSSLLSDMQWRLLQGAMLNISRKSSFQCSASGGEDDDDDSFHFREGKNLLVTPCQASYRGERFNAKDFAEGDFTDEDFSCFVDVVKFQSEQAISKLATIYDEPKCGFSGEKCASNKYLKLGILGGVLGLACGLAMILFCQHKLLAAERKITGLQWKISPSDIKDCSTRPRGSTRSLAQLNPSGDFYYPRVGIYQGTTVCQKPAFPKDSKNRFPRELMKDIHCIRSIKHRNVCNFFGVCLEQQTTLLISEYQARGSLRDVLSSDCTTLDEAFIESLMMDLIKGMYFLHDQYGPHGYLRASNCVVSGRWVLQVTDYGLTELRANQRRNKDSFKWLFNKLYCAPELLKEEEDEEKVTATKEADVYAFGIILHETLNRIGPFGLSDVDFDCNYETALNKILDEIKRGPNTERPLKRPSLAQIIEKPFGTNIQMINLMKSCWAESSSLRPTFKALKTDFNKHSGERRPADLMDQLVSMMEKHNNNLEKLIESRTQELVREKELTDQLLYSVLPRPVAQSLKHGINVEPQSFDSVTIYFSDIVGFTALSAESTPLQIVTFLDELYRMFDDIISGYDVYKVETIGDAYMVVSGLPEKQNDLRHAGEIASMSLELITKSQTDFKIAHRPDEPLKLRVGVHTGPVMAGVVGLSMPRYCLFGDTVNTAARFESNGLVIKLIQTFAVHCSNGLPNKIHISSECRKALEELGQLETHWLLGVEDGAIKRRMTPQRTSENRFQRLGDQQMIDLHRRSRSSNRVSFGDDKTCSLPHGDRASPCIARLPERQRLLDSRHRCSSISGIASDFPHSRLRKGLNSAMASQDKGLPNSLLNLTSSRLDEVVESKPLLPKLARGCDRRSHPQSPLIESSV